MEKEIKEYRHLISAVHLDNVSDIKNSILYNKKLSRSADNKWPVALSEINNTLMFMDVISYLNDESMNDPSCESVSTNPFLLEALQNYLAYSQDIDDETVSDDVVDKCNTVASAVGSLLQVMSTKKKLRYRARNWGHILKKARDIFPASVIEKSKERLERIFPM